jgi:hypothetical protein
MNVSDWNELVVQAMESHPEKAQGIQALNQKVWAQCVEYEYLRRRQSLEPTNRFRPLNARLHIAHYLKDKPQALYDVLIEGDPKKQMEAQKHQVFAATREVKKLIAERKQREAETVGDKFKHQSLDTTGIVSETRKEKKLREFAEQFKMKRANSRSRERGDLEH